jgi:hypothetical protein
MAGPVTCGTRQKSGSFSFMTDSVIEREEAVALLFNVSDILQTLLRIETLLREDDEEEADER